MAGKDGTERRVYNLPDELIGRIRNYQAHVGISSETEAVKRLLDTSLKMSDRLDDIMAKLKTFYIHEKDPRILVRDVLATHPLVHLIRLKEGTLEFKFRDSEWGRLTSSGKLQTGEGDEQDWVRTWSDWKFEAHKPSKWDQKKSDLDDDIPF